MNWLKLKSVPENYPVFRWVFLVIAIAFSIMAWERIIYADAAFTAFNVLNLLPAVEHHRYTQWLVLAPAYLGVKLGLPIQFIIVLLSLTPVFLAWIIAEFLRKSRNDISGLQLLYFPSIFLISGPDFQFLGTAEMISALIFAGAFALDRNPLPTTIWLTLSYLAHPGILPALFFLLIIKELCWKNYVVFALVVIAKQLLIPPNPYEVSILQKLNWQDGLAFFNSWGFNYFISSLFGGWATPYLLIFLLILIFSDLKNRLFLGIGVLISLFLAFIYREGESDMMMQKSFAPILPILWFLATKNSARNQLKPNPNSAVNTILQPIYKLKTASKIHYHSIRSTILIFCCLWGSFYVFRSYQFHHSRLKLLDLQLTTLSHPPKKAVGPEYFHPDQFKINWAIPYESLMRSAYLASSLSNSSIFDSSKLDSSSSSNSPRPTKNTSNSVKKTININTFCIVNDSNEAIKKPLGIDQFLGAPFAYPIQVKDLNPTYFNGLSKDQYLWMGSN